MTETLASRLALIAEKIRAQQIQLGPPIPLPDLLALETRYGITFPEPFRQFVTQIGNGSIRSSRHQWIPLAKPSRKKRTLKSHSPSAFENMKKKFPFTMYWDWNEGDKSHEGTRNQTRHGQLLLNTDGRHNRWVLIVKGPERGKVWSIHRKGITPTLPSRDFLEWFEDWLDSERFTM